ncbi:SdpI family protein [Dietzia alimentaria]|uniref:SdpI family protein n=1 Tax=Dietzia alimentaria TaxID=665550 RepID=UPI00029B00A2|nr:SdpI family protein [Dietzia alimentaria]
MDATESLILTVSVTSSTLLGGGIAAIMPRMVGDEPNAIVGIRTRATQSSDKAWQLAHQVSQPILRGTVCTAAVGLFIQLVTGVVTGFASVASSFAAVAVAVLTFSVLIYAGFKGDAAARSLNR